ncbi:mitochondrial import inner membrane translocase subunit TIM23-3-like [Spinacia oleracea]|uniref:Mitochondrial import inner membrane translocase subunit TIM23-3-like n=1 Tax=Spinacia oleracea TaxID=3562 RepID=A0A9R0JTM7_SPIOL|nr:mitochondrial import inner membrane translocase subunit TIM23-3-like [Spinacia oleracea]
MEDFSSDSTPNYKQYSPYQNLNPNTPNMKLYNLPTTPEHLFEEEAFRSRNFYDNLTFYTGSSYLTGSVVGAVKGSFEGLSATEYGESLKIRTNRMLNTGGMVGRRFGNSAGILAVIYTGVESSIIYKRDTDDVLGSLMAGMGTGAVYRLPAGIRAAAIASVVGGIVVGAVVSGKHLLTRSVPKLSI